MGNKRSKQSVSTATSGEVPGKGSANNLTMPTKGGRNATTNQGHRGAGQLAPRPQTSKESFLGQSSATAPAQAGLARVKGVGTGDTGGRLPVQHPTVNLVGKRIGQANPDTAATATKKPNRKGGAAFYGET